MIDELSLDDPLGNLIEHPIRVLHANVAIRLDVGERVDAIEWACVQLRR